MFKEALTETPFLPPNLRFYVRCLLRDNPQSQGFEDSYNDFYSQLALVRQEPEPEEEEFPDSDDVLERFYRELELDEDWPDSRINWEWDELEQGIQDDYGAG